MPLVTDNILEARSAYNALELNTVSIQQRASTLQATVDNLSAKQHVLSQSAGLLSQYAVSQVQANAQLTAEQAGQVSPDVTLESFIASLGLAVALGEASMPGRTISSVTATVQSYLTFAPGPDGKSQVTGLRFYQPELGTSSVLATTSFELTKVTAQPGAPAPRSLYAVLQDKQSLFADPFWTRFVTGNPPAQPAAQIITEITKVFASIGAWSFPLIVQEAAAIAGFEITLSTLLAGAVPPERAAAYATVVAGLSNLAKALDPATRAGFVAGDLFALTAALDATTNIANTLRP